MSKMQGGKVKELKEEDIIYLKGTKSVDTRWNYNYKHEVGMKCKVSYVYSEGYIGLSRIDGGNLGTFLKEDLSTEPIELIKETYTNQEVLSIMESNKR